MKDGPRLASKPLTSNVGAYMRLEHRKRCGGSEARSSGDPGQCQYYHCAEEAFSEHGSGSGASSGGWEQMSFGSQFKDGW